MTIDIQRLEEQLLRMWTDSAPGREFCEAIAELARTRRFEQLREILPTVVYDELWERYRRDPATFIARWEKLAQEMQHGFVQHARQRITSLTRLQKPRNRTDAPAWQEIQRALDAQRNDLLRAAFALELLEMIEPAVRRATHLRECVVNQASSAEADRYLDEATRCYLFGLFTACSVMCRSLLEEATREKLDPTLGRVIRSRYRNTATLGNLLHEVNNNLLLTGIDPGFPRIANKVNDAGRKAVHRGAISEEDARECLRNTRAAIELLLRK